MAYRPPTYEVWRDVLATINEDTPPWAVENLGAYYLKRYCAGDVNAAHGNAEHHQISTLQLPQEFVEAVEGGRLVQRPYFVSWFPGIEEVEKHSLTAPLLLLAAANTKAYVPRGGVVYTVTASDRLACIDFDVTPDHGPEIREYVEAMLHLNYVQ